MMSSKKMVFDRTSACNYFKRRISLTQPGQAGCSEA
jgi:hypothetical protein